MTELAALLAVLAAVFAALAMALVTLLCRMYARAVCGAIARGDDDERLMRGSSLRSRRRGFCAAAAKILTFLLAAAALVAIGRFAVFSLSGGREYFGHMPLAVASGSMSKASCVHEIPAGSLPGFERYDLIFIAKVRAEDLAVGDIAAYRSAGGELIIHRIVEIRNMGGREYYVFRGDANMLADPVYVSFEAVAGKYTGVCIRYAGAPALFLQSSFGIATAAVIIYIVSVCGGALGSIARAERLRLFELNL